MASNAMNIDANTIQVRSLFADSKARLCDRVKNNIEGIGSILRHIIKASKSVETLSHSAKYFALQESVIENTDLNVKKMQICLQQMTFQLDDINKSCEIMDKVIAKSR